MIIMKKLAFMRTLGLRQPKASSIKLTCLMLAVVMTYGCSGNDGSNASSVAQEPISEQPSSQATTSSQSSLVQASSSAVSSSPASEPTPSSESSSSQPPGNTTQITGTVTFDFAPFEISLGEYSHSVRLDVNNLIPKPARFITVEARDKSGEILGLSRTNEDGQYSINVPQNTDLRIVAKSELIITKGLDNHVEIAAVDFRKNTPVIYEVASDLLNSSNATTQFLHAKANNDGNKFLAGRLAAPFSIIDTLYDGVLYMEEYDATLAFPKLLVDWNDGRSGSLFYAKDDDGQRIIHLNGASNVEDLNDPSDTSGDKPSQTISDYSVDVIMHEFFHYVQDNVLPMRDDSGGGGLTRNHPDSDLALVLSEASADAFALFVKNRAIFSTLISSSLSGFGEEYEKYSSASEAPGYFEKGTVAALLWDLFDGTDEENDNVEVGIKVFDIFTSPAYNNATGVTSVYTILNAVKTLDGVDAAAVDQLAQSHSIYGTGPLGTGETNDLGVPSILPVYQQLTIDTGALNVCIESSGTLTRYLTTAKRVLFNNPKKQSVTLTLKQTSGPEDRELQVSVKTSHQGKSIGRILKTDDMNNLSKTFVDLDAGQSYMISTSSSPLGGESTPGIKACFDISLTTN